VSTPVYQLTTTHHAVAAPHEDQTDAALDRHARLLRCLAALVHLVPERIRVASLGQGRTQFAEAAAE
jgi:hypothetical protein